MHCMVPFFLPAIPALTRAKVQTRTGTSPSFSGSVVDITSGEGGTYSRANVLPDGNILAAYTAFPDSNKQLTLVTSSDCAAPRPPNSSDLDNAYPLQLPSGRVVLAYRNPDKIAGTTAYTTCRITLSYSDDDGASRAFLSDAAVEPAGPTGIGEPFLRNMQDGMLQLHHSRESNASDQDSMLRTSSDGGSTWSEAQVITGADIIARHGMLGVTTVSGTSLVAVFESEQNGLFAIDSISSGDDGETWGNLQRVYTPNGTKTNAGAPQIANVGGTLLVSLMTDEDTELGAWINGAAAKLLSSADGGVTWGSKLELFGVQANWPSLLELDDRSLLFLADHDGAKSQKIGLS